MNDSRAVLAQSSDIWREPKESSKKFLNCRGDEFILDNVTSNKQTSGVSVLHMHIDAAIHARVRETAKREGRTIRNLVEEALMEFTANAEDSEGFARIRRVMRQGVRW